MRRIVGLMWLLVCIGCSAAGNESQFWKHSAKSPNDTVFQLIKTRTGGGLFRLDAVHIEHSGSGKLETVDYTAAPKTDDKKIMVTLASKCPVGARVRFTLVYFSNKQPDIDVREGK